MSTVPLAWLTRRYFTFLQFLTNMFEIYCPYCQESRQQGEFTPGEEAFIERPKQPAELSDADWADYVFFRNNEKGVHWEQWVHTMGCRKYFLVQRSTVNHEITAVKKLSETADIHRSKKVVIPAKAGI